MILKWKTWTHVRLSRNAEVTKCDFHHLKVHNSYGFLQKFTRADKKWEWAPCSQEEEPTHHLGHRQLPSPGSRDQLGAPFTHCLCQIQEVPCTRKGWKSLKIKVFLIWAHCNILGGILRNKSLCYMTGRSWKSAPVADWNDKMFVDWARLLEILQTLKTLKTENRS